MTPEEAKKLLEERAKLNEVIINVAGLPAYPIIRDIDALLEAARIVERERCVKLFRENIYLIECQKDIDDLEQKILSPNPNIV